MLEIYILWRLLGDIASIILASSVLIVLGLYYLYIRLKIKYKDINEEIE